MKVGMDVGFPKDTIWGLLIGGLGFGALIYLFQVYVFSQVLHTILRKWDLAMPGDTSEDKKNRFIKWFDRNAEAIKNHSQQKENLSNYMDYNWAACHTLFMTGWLILIFYLFREPSSVLDCLGGWVIGISVAFLFFASYLFFTLIRVNKRKE